MPFVEGLSHAPGSGPDWLGNLLRPIRVWQVGGIWPARDFRVGPVSGAATGLLLAAVAAGAGWALWRAVRLRAWGVLAYAGVLVSAIAVIVATDWAWGEGKALAIASPVLLALAGAGAGQLVSAEREHVAARRRSGRARRARDRRRLVVRARGPGDDADARTTATLELQRIGERFAGRGPTLATEFEPYAGRWFLRRLAPEVAGELRRRTVPLNGGGVLAKGESADIDRFALDGARALPAARRAPLARREPAAVGVPARLARPLVRGLGARRRPARGRPSSAWGRTWIRRRCPRAPTCAGSRGSRAPAGPSAPRSPRRPPSRASTPARRPAGWRVLGGGSLVPDGHGTGTARATVAVPAAGRYEVWVGGAFRGSAQVAVDGVRPGRLRHQLSYPGNWVPFGTADLSAGPHAVTVRLDGNGLHPGVHGIDALRDRPGGAQAGARRQPDHRAAREPSRALVRAPPRLARGGAVA